MEIEMNTQLRELNDADLDTVSGAAVNNYKFCWFGPRGEGLYPLYIPCGDDQGTAGGSGGGFGGASASISGSITL
jgi:hypothetical protein